MEIKYITDDAIFPIKFPIGFEGYVKTAVGNTVIYDRFKKRAFCTSCENKFTYKFSAKADEIRRCPYCGRTQYWTPHTRGNVTSKIILFFFNDGEELKFVIVSAYWKIKEKTPIDDIEIITNIYPEEVGILSREKQEAYLHYAKDYWNLTMPIYVHKDLDYAGVFPNTKVIIENSFLKHASKYLPLCCGANYLIKKMAIFAKYPQAEYVCKAGFEELIKNKVFRTPTHIRPNWKADNIAEFFRLSHQDMDKLKQWDMLDLDSIAWYQLLKKHYKKITKSMLKEINSANIDISTYYNDFKNHRPLDLCRFILKVYDESKPCCHHGYYSYSIKGVIREYKDYLEQLEKLEYPLNEYYMYPKKFSEAHDKVSAEYNEMLMKIKAKENELKNQKYKKHLEKLEKYCYEDEEFLIRPLRSVEEFTAEGKINRNCVASYFSRASEGKANIFVIRKKTEPNAPYVTVELSTGFSNILQCYAKGNTIPPESVIKFSEKWLKEVVIKRKKGKAA